MSERDVSIRHNGREVESRIGRGAVVAVLLVATGVTVLWVALCVLLMAVFTLLASPVILASYAITRVRRSRQ